jgi:poly(3-hydroxybutyrate) depolymerase
MSIRTPLLLLALLGTACSDDSTSIDASVAPLDAAPVDAFAVVDSNLAPDALVTTTCETLQAGWNDNFVVDGLARGFYLDLPSDVATGGPFPVVFNWHGLGDTAANMRGLLASDVDHTGFHFILVTPEDSDFAIYGNVVDWEVFSVVGATNREARLFDEVLACLQSRWSVDADHVHSVGFSLGAIVTDMLGTVRGEDLASILTYSGGYLSDDANVATLGTVGAFVSWPDPAHTNGYAQVILHGGTADQYALGTYATIHFDTFAANDTTYLNGLAHDVVVCDHGGGHTVPTSTFGADQILEFFAAHPRGTTSSPYAAGLPTDYPDYCAFSAQGS